MEFSPKTSSARHSDAAVGADCPAPEVLRAFLFRHLPPAEDKAFARHLEGCEQCQAAAEEALSLPAWSDDLLWFPDQPSASLPTRDLQSPGTTEATPEGEKATPFKAIEPIRILADRFELRRTIGMGGCGAVFAAWDNVLRRDVAVKVPHWMLFENPKVQQQFAREARAAARLNHPNIVPVHEAVIGAAENCFLVSELIRGPSLEAWLAGQHAQGGAVSIRTAAAILADVATGVEFAHRAEVVHRDLKPSNILLAPVPTAELQFTPRITDFGLARLSEEATVTTVEGGVLGTIPYMSPEQATGRSGVGPSCDIYALGVILYELLTGRLPIAGSTPAALITAIPTQLVESPRRQRAEIPADLEAVCLKCLEKRPQDRYRSAGELALDLRRFLAGKAVTARLPGRREQAVRWVRRNPATTAVLATLTVAVLAVVGVLADANGRQSALISELQHSDLGLSAANEQLKNALGIAEERRIQAEQERTKANQARRQAEAERRRTQEGLYVSEFRRAMRAWEEEDLAEVQRILDKLDQPEFAPFRGLECNWLRTKLIRPHRKVLRLPGAAYTVALTPDGESLAAAGQDSVVKLVRYADGAPVAEWPTNQGEVNRLAFVDEGRKLWTSGDDGSLCQWEVATQQELLRIVAHAPEQAHDLRLIPEHNVLVSTGTDGKVRLWDPLTGESRGELEGDGQTVVGLSLHPDGERLFGASRSSVFCWKLTDRSVAMTWRLKNDSRPLSIALVAGGNHLLVAKNNGVLELSGAMTGVLIEKTSASSPVQQLIRVSDDDVLYAIDASGVLIVIRLKRDGPTLLPSLELRRLSRLIDSRPFQAIASLDGRDLVTTDGGGGVVVWPRATLDPRQVVEFRAYDDEAAFSEDGMIYCFAADLRAAVCARGSRISSWDIDNLDNRPLTDVSPRSIGGIGRLPNGELVTSENGPETSRWLVRRSSRDGHSIAEWRLENAKERLCGVRIESSLNRAFVSHPIRGSPAFHVLLLDSSDLQAPLKLKRSSLLPEFDDVHSTFAITGDDWLEVRDTTTRNILWAQQLPADIISIACSRDGRLFATASKDRVIRAWESQSGRLISEMSGHRRGNIKVVFSSDGRTLFSGDSDGERGEMRIWHVRTGDLLGMMGSQPMIGVGELHLSIGDDRLLMLNAIRYLRVEEIRRR